MTAFFILMAMAFLGLVISMILLPFCLHDDKSEKWRGIDIYQIPEMFDKSWYKKDKYWVRILLISSLSILLFGFLFLWLNK